MATELTKGLRALADWLDENPQVSEPGGTHWFNVWMHSQDPKAELKVIIQSASGPFEKIYEGENFSLRRRFGEHVVLDFNTPRTSICKRVVKGTREQEEIVIPARTVEIVEWECSEPILRPSEEGSPSKELAIGGENK